MFELQVSEAGQVGGGPPIFPQESTANDDTNSGYDSGSNRQPGTEPSRDAPIGVESENKQLQGITGWSNFETGEDAGEIGKFLAHLWMFTFNLP